MLYILNKPGRLTSEEFAIIQEHPNIGASILDNINGFEDIASAVRCHHERYDGTGYPNQVSGDQIPLFSRMLAVCDTFDAMTSARCYRQPFSEQEAVMEIRRCSGSQFDPEISEAFIEMLYYRDNIGELDF
ncbi:HD domain-containing protein [bacterium BFN5]|nr:HD domain-containing protein [bacterium BFN5]